MLLYPSYCQKLVSSMFDSKKTSKIKKKLKDGQLSLLATVLTKDCLGREDIYRFLLLIYISAVGFDVLVKLCSSVIQGLCKCCTCLERNLQFYIEDIVSTLSRMQTSFIELVYYFDQGNGTV